jgi:DNA-binding MarR family transcriptional regulator
MPDPILCVCTNLKMAARTVGRSYDEKLAPAGINSTQFAILANNGRAGEIATIALADLLQMERTTLYRALNILQRKGLVRSRRGKGREQLLVLTQSGVAKHAEAQPLWDQVQTSYTSHLGTKWPRLLKLLRDAQESPG